MTSPLCIVMYHAVADSPLPVEDWCFLDERVFRLQIQHLARRCDVLPLSTATARLEHGPFQRPTVALTFDDGFQSFHDVVFPILRSEGVPAALFVTTGLVDTADTVWYCRLHDAITHTSRTSFIWNGKRFDLSTPAAKAEASSVLQAALKMHHQSRLLHELRTIVLMLGSDPDATISESSPYRLLNREAIERLAATDLIELGAHTHSHAILSLLSPEEQRDEISRSVEWIGEISRCPCTIFAYPNGRRQDYDDETVHTLTALGVRISVTAIEGANTRETSPLELKRYGIGAPTHDADFVRLMEAATNG